MTRSPLLRSPLFGLALLGLLGTGVAGCGGSGGDSDGTPAPRVRAVNLSPAAALDFTLNGDSASRDVAYLQEDLPTIARNDGTYDFGIRASDSSVDLVSEGYTLQTGADYVYAAVGLVNPGDTPSQRLRGLLVGYDRRTPGESRTRVIAINAVLPETGTEPSPVVFQAPGDSPQFTFGSVAFGSSATQVLDAGPQTIEVRPDGATGTLATATVSLLPGRTYIATYSGVTAGTGTSAPAVRFLLVP
ncbi:hypothetical protein EON77_01575 [bacterium]|nr:MAG: hypothetical protein EON77_01575 [bacterium]